MLWTPTTSGPWECPKPPLKDSGLARGSPWALHPYSGSAWAHLGLWVQGVLPCWAVGAGGQAGTHRRRHTCGSTATRLTTARAGSPRHTPPRTGCSWARASPGAAGTGKHRRQLPQAPATSCHSRHPSKSWQQLCGAPAEHQWCLWGAFPRVQWGIVVSVLKSFTSKHPSGFDSHSKRTTLDFQ